MKIPPPSLPTSSAPAGSGPDSGLSDPTVEPALNPQSPPDASWKPIPGPLFGPTGVPQARDVAQGRLGDCGLLAVLAEVARTHPQLLAKAIEPRADGSGYDVHLFTGEPPRPVAVAVDDRLPWRDGHLLYANRRDSAALWPELIEKAVAKLRGGYVKLGVDALGEVTGWRRRALAPLFGNPPALVSALQDALGRHDVIVAATWGEARFAQLPASVTTGIVPGHAYSVLGLRTAPNGTVELLLRNPWGYHEPGNSQGGDGRFWLPFARFLQLFHAASAGGPDAPSPSVAARSAADSFG